MFDNLTIKGSDIEALGRHLGVKLKDVPDITVGDLKDGTLAVESDASAKTRRKQAKDAQRAIKVGSPVPVVEAVPLQVQPIIDDGVPNTIRDRWKKMLGDLAQTNTLDSPISKAEAEYVSEGDLHLLNIYRDVRSELSRSLLYCRETGNTDKCYLKNGRSDASYKVDRYLHPNKMGSDPVLQKYEEFPATPWTRFKRFIGVEKPPIPFGALKGGAALLLVIAALASQADGEVMMASSGAALAMQAAGRGMKDREDALKVAGTSSGSAGAGGSAGGGDRRSQVLVQLKEATQKCQSFGTLDLVNNPLTNLPGWAIGKVLGQDHEASKTYWCQRKAQLEQELTNLDALALDQARGEAQARGLNVPPPAPSGGGIFGGGGGRAAGAGGAGAPVGGSGAAGLADPGLLSQAQPPPAPSLLERAACFFGMCLTPPASSGGGLVQDINDSVDNFFGNIFRVALIAAAVLIVLGGLWIYTAGSTVQAVIPAVVPHISSIVTAGGNAGATYLGGVGQVVQPVGQLISQITPTGQLAQVGGDVAGLLRAVGGGR